MPPDALRTHAASGGLLSIGQVLARLSPEFPKLTASKLRFLEQQGIVTPMRTEAGYRKFSPGDMERLRTGLQLQRDHYLPLPVIREYLDERDAGREPGMPGQPTSILPQARRYSRDELIQAAAASQSLMREAVGAGLLAGGGGSFDDQDLALMRALVALEAHGIEPRHLRAVRQSAERDVSLIEAALAPLLTRTDAAARGRAGEIAPELSRRIDDVRAVLVRAALARITV